MNEPVKLQRANGLTTTHGRPTAAVRQSSIWRRAVEDIGPTQNSTSLPPPITPKLSRFGSIKARFQKTSVSLEEKLARTKSLPSRHGRTKSDAGDRRVAFAPPPLQRPATLHAVSDPTPSIRRAPPRRKGTMAGDVTVPVLLQQGTPMTKVSAGKRKPVTFRLDPDQGQILWESKKHRIIPIENIKELRSGSDARYYREQFQLSQEYEDRWLTIIYILEGEYKTLHIIAATVDVFAMWDSTLRKLHAIRQALMSGLGNIEMRENVWEKQYWKSADQDTDQKLNFPDVERLCRRLNIHSAQEDLLRLFKQADKDNLCYLDFEGFQYFVKLLKSRPELGRLYKKISGDSTTGITYSSFEKFMKNSQKSELSPAEIRAIFVKYSTGTQAQSMVGKEPESVPKDAPGDRSSPGEEKPSTTSAEKPVVPAVTEEAALPSGLAPAPAPALAQEASQSSPTPADAAPVPVPSETVPAPVAKASSVLAVIPGTPVPVALGSDSGPEHTMSLSGLSAFLLSLDNAVFIDQNSKVTHDMTKPLSEYYISSSHNTYLVGHQLMGVSTIEGYIRALLHSCRSVEIDIYDGDEEPVIYHGKTFTSKVSLREVCQAIAKYAFVASPYPVIISAEVHCGLAQQEMIAQIMIEVLGDALVRAPVDGRPKIDILPSPEALKGRFLLKAKNLYVVTQEGVKEKPVTVDAESSTTDTSASESEVESGGKRASAVKELKHEFSRARSVMDRVRGKKSTPKAPEEEKVKVKMSFALVGLLVYTVGVKCRGINKKEEYAVEHIFSLSENTANKIIKDTMYDLIKHSRTHVVRTYPKGTRVSSSNYEPHRFWSAGVQLVAINWQTFDLGYMINHAMFQRNGRAGYVLKPMALRAPDKELLSKRTKHFLDITVISAQQLPRPKDADGHEIFDKGMVDPYVEVSIHVPDWTHSPYLPSETKATAEYSPPVAGTAVAASSARTITHRTGVVKNNGFNPVWEESLALPYDCVGGMLDLIFVQFAVKQEGADDDDDPLAVYCASLGSLRHGFRHLPLHDSQLSQYLFSTLFVELHVRNVK